MKKWFKRILQILLGWFTSQWFFKKPRLWDSQEWAEFSAKEKFWIWWKHHWFVRGTGSAEIDQFTMPIKEMILYGGIILSNAAVALMYLDIKIDYFSLLVFVGASCVVLWLVNFSFQWMLGNYIDNLDLTALNSEIAVRRNKMFRELRDKAKKESWKKDRKVN